MSRSVDVLCRCSVLRSTHANKSTPLYTMSVELALCVEYFYVTAQRALEL